MHVPICSCSISRLLMLTNLLYTNYHPTLFPEKRGKESLHGGRLLNTGMKCLANIRYVNSRSISTKRSQPLNFWQLLLLEYSIDCTVKKISLSINYYWNQICTKQKGSFIESEALYSWNVIWYSVLQLTTKICHYNKYMNNDNFVYKLMPESYRFQQETSARSSNSF